MSEKPTEGRRHKLKMTTSIELDYLRSQAVWYLKHFLLTPYLWAGNDFAGLDCSGLVIEVLQSVGILEHGSDYTANDLYLKFKDKKRDKPCFGSLAFWFKNGKATHVEMIVDELHCIGASGGDSKTKTVEDAIRQNAFVKMRPVNYRGVNYKIVDPFKVGE